MLLIPIKQSLINNAYSWQIPKKYDFLENELNTWIKDDINGYLPKDDYVGGIGYLTDEQIGVAYRVVEGPKDAFNRATKIVNGLLFPLAEVKGVSLTGILEHSYLESTDVQITVDQYIYTPKKVNILNNSSMYEYASETITQSRLFKVQQSLEQPPLVVDLRHDYSIPQETIRFSNPEGDHKMLYKKLILIIFVICIFMLGYICGKINSEKINSREVSEEEKVDNADSFEHIIKIPKNKTDIHIQLIKDIHIEVIEENNIERTYRVKTSGGISPIKSDKIIDNMKERPKTNNGNRVKKKSWGLWQ